MANLIHMIARCLSCDGLLPLTRVDAQKLRTPAARENAPQKLCFCFGGFLKVSDVISTVNLTFTLNDLIEQLPPQIDYSGEPGVDASLQTSLLGCHKLNNGACPAIVSSSQSGGSPVVTLHSFDNGTSQRTPCARQTPVIQSCSIRNRTARQTGNSIRTMRLTW